MELKIKNYLETKIEAEDERQRVVKKPQKGTEVRFKPMSIDIIALAII